MQHDMNKANKFSFAGRGMMASHRLSQISGSIALVSGVHNRVCQHHCVVVHATLQNELE